jgi:hypothetical protein
MQKKIVEEVEITPRKFVIFQINTKEDLLLVQKWKWRK